MIRRKRPTKGKDGIYLGVERMIISFLPSVDDDDDEEEDSFFTSAMSITVVAVVLLGTGVESERLPPKKLRRSARVCLASLILVCRLQWHTQHVICWLQCSQKLTVKT